MRTSAIFLLLVSLLAGALLHAAPSYATSKRLLRIATQESTPPFAMPDGQSGLSVDIVREALHLEGYDMALTFLPSPRMIEALTTGKIDAAFPLRSAHLSDSIYASDSHITFSNVAVSLEENRITIRDVDDLAKCRVDAFLGASSWLPKEFRNMAATNPDYAEQNDQKAQVASFFARRDRVVVLEKHIFEYYARKGGCNPLRLRYVIHNILPPAHVAVAFADKNIRDAFNHGLKKLRESGRYDAIVTKYVGGDE